MTYQIVYSSEATTPMQTDDLEALLEHARTRNGVDGISGALVYSEGLFLQILEGERSKLSSLMGSISKDVRHEKVTILREGEVSSASFSTWKMAYVAATPEQVARWAGLDVHDGRGDVTGDAAEELHRTARFARDILELLEKR